MVRLKNYTTSISAERSIAEIESLLLEFGAENIGKKVKNKKFTHLMFTINVNGSVIPFKLPSNLDKVTQFLTNEYNGSHSRRSKVKSDFADEAYRVTWRILKDWVHAQLSIIATEMVTLEEVFLPYIMVDKDHTIADEFKNGKLQKLLPEYQP